MSEYNNKEGALKVVETSPNKIVPSEDMIMEYISPLQDDSWVRQSVFVHIEELEDTEKEMVHKKELLQAHVLASMRKKYADKISDSGMPADMINDENLLIEKSKEKDAILEGIRFHEKFMENYKMKHSAEDRVRASNYKRTMMQDFRQRSSNTHVIEGKKDNDKVTPAPMQQEDLPAPVQKEEKVPAPVQQEEEAPAPV